VTYIVYDTETTGLKPSFDQGLQFAAVVADDDFNVVDSINLRCGLQPQHPRFASVIARAMGGQYEEREPSTHIEEHICGGFPSPADARNMARFRATPTPERHEVCRQLQDDKYRISASACCSRNSLPPCRRQCAKCLSTGADSADSATENVTG
jgi:exonuclease I